MADILYTIGYNSDDAKLHELLNRASKIMSDSDLAFELSLDSGKAEDNLKRLELNIKRKIDSMQKEVNGFNMDEAAKQLTEISNEIKNIGDIEPFGKSGKARLQSSFIKITADQFRDLVVDVKKYGGELDETIEKAYRSLNITKPNLASVESVLDNIQELAKTSEYLNKITSESHSGNGVGISEEDIKSIKNGIGSIQEKLNEFDTKLSGIGDSEVFSKLQSQTDGLKSSIIEINGKFDAMLDKIGLINKASINASNMTFHAGDLSAIYKGNYKRSENLGYSLNGILNGNDYSFSGGGTFWGQDIKDLQNFMKTFSDKTNFKYYATNIDKYYTYLNETEEDAQHLFDFLGKLNTLCIQNAGIKLPETFNEYKGFNTEELYTDYNNFFKNAKMTHDEFSDFCSNMTQILLDGKVKIQNTEDGIKVVMDEAYSNLDNIAVCFMKAHGYQGINNTHLTESDFSGTMYGSSIFDLDKLDPYIKAFDTAEEAIAYQKQLQEQLGAVTENNVNSSISIYNLLVSKIDELNAKLKECDELITQSKSGTLTTLNDTEKLTESVKEVTDANEKLSESAKETANDVKKEEQSFEAASDNAKNLSENKEKVTEANTALALSAEKTSHEITEESQSVNKMSSSANEIITSLERVESVEGEVINDTQELTNSFKKFQEQAKHTGNYNFDNMTKAFQSFYANQGLEYKNASVKLDGETWKLLNAQVTYYDDTLKQSVTDTFTLDRATEQLNRTINLHDDGQARTKAIEQEIKAIERKATVENTALKLSENKYSQKINLDKITKELKSLGLLSGETKEKIQEMYYSLSKVSSQSGLSAWNSQFKNIQTEMSNVIKSAKNMSSESSKISGWEEQIEQLEKAEGKIEEYQLQLNILKQKVHEYRQLDAFGKDAETAKEATAEISKMMSVMNNPLYNKTNSSGKYAGGVTNFKSIDEAREAYTNLGYTIKSTTANSLVAIKEINGSLETVKITAHELDGAVEGAGLQLRAVSKINFNNMSKQVTGLTWAWNGLNKIIRQYARIYLSPMDFIRYFRNGINVLKEFDSALTTISYTMDVSKKQLNDLGESVLQLSKDMKISVQDAMSVSQIYANMDTTPEKIIELATPTVIMSNLTGADASTTSNQIQAVVQQFNILEDESMHIADVYDYISSRVAIDYSRGIESISEAVKVAGSTAAEAGLSFEQLSALTAKVAEKTRMEGSSIGNGLKTIFTRLSKVGKLSDEVDNETLSNASASLHEVGVEVYNLDGSYREFDVIMSELAPKWENLTDAQRANLSFNIAATRQTNLLSALLSSYSDSMQLATEATETEGNALANQEKYLESYSGKIQGLFSGLQSFGVHFLDTDAFKFLIDSLTKIINSVDQLTKSFGGFLIAATGLGMFLGIKNLGRGKLY